MSRQVTDAVGAALDLYAIVLRTRAALDEALRKEHAAHGYAPTEERCRLESRWSGVLKSFQDARDALNRVLLEGDPK